MLIGRALVVLVAVLFCFVVLFALGLFGGFLDEEMGRWQVSLHAVTPSFLAFTLSFLGVASSLLGLTPSFLGVTPSLARPALPVLTSSLHASRSSGMHVLDLSNANWTVSNGRNITVPGSLPSVVCLAAQMPDHSLQKKLRFYLGPSRSLRCKGH